MTAWDYGEEGRRYPVAPNSLWQAGEHLFVVGSVLELGEAAKALAVSAGGPTLVYCDPPWNQGNVNSFQTKAGLPHAEHTWLDLYAAVVALAGETPVWLEGGRRQADQVQQLLPGPERAIFEITYYRRSPCVLHYSGPTAPPCDPRGMDDEDTPDFVLAAYPAGLVFDPCAGRGLTSRAAEAAGWRSVNVELNPNRVSAALSRLAEATGLEPELVA